MMSSYHVIIIALVFGVAYWISLKNQNFIAHKKLWNWILAGSFVLSGLLGLLLAIILDLGIRVDWYGNILWYHVEFGIVMALVAVAHLLWHLRYFWPKKN